MAACLVCSAQVEPFVSFGAMPIANGFLQEEGFADEYFSDLQVGLCPECHVTQLTNLVDPRKLFHDNYAYFSSISVRTAEHFREFARQVQDQFLSTSNPFVLEIGSNDGIMLRNFAEWGIKHLGVEPSRNVALEALRQGIATRCSFFDEATAADILREQGPADVILAANVVSHIPNIHGLIAGVASLLKQGGGFIFEEPYLGDIIEKTAYDQFYDEHAFYFCLSSLSNVLRRHDMAIVDAFPQQVHGGSMRYVIAKSQERPVSRRVTELVAREASLGLSQRATFDALKRRIEMSRDQLTYLLESLKRQGKRIVGYGATSKSTTVTNYCGIGPDLIDFISDTTPGKQGKFSPGMHIPVKPYEEFVARYPDYALLFAWNHGEEIIAKEGNFLRNGGRFISFVPEVRILD